MNELFIFLARQKKNTLSLMEQKGNTRSAKEVYFRSRYIAKMTGRTGSRERRAERKHEFYYNCHKL